MDALDQVLDRIMPVEGGIATLADGAGETRWGQTPAWLAQFNLPVPQSQQQASDNYRTWADLTHLDLIVGTRFDLLGWAVVDMAVNSGQRLAIQMLQRRLNVTADGVIGPVTLTALGLVNRTRLAAQFIADHARFYGRDITAKPTDAEFAASWGNRLATQIEALGEEA